MDHAHALIMFDRCFCFQMCDLTGKSTRIARRKHRNIDEYSSVVTGGIVLPRNAGRPGPGRVHCCRASEDRWASGSIRNGHDDVSAG